MEVQPLGAEGRANPHKDALAFFDAIPRSWPLSADDDYPEKIIALDEGRERALETYKGRNF